MTPNGHLQRIVLTGFMGSGKTTVGRIAAARLGWRFADLDEAIEAAAGRTVPQIFSEQGEPAFRLIETSVLASLLQEAGVVIALGGGAVTTPENRARMAKSPGTALVYLHAPFGFLYERCLLQARDPEATARPLLQERGAAEQRYGDRLPLYASLAAHRIDISAETPETAADAVLGILFSAEDLPA